MGEKEPPPLPPLPEPKTGPCFFGEQHTFTTVTAIDPFTHESVSRTVCTGCGAGA